MKCCKFTGRTKPRIVLRDSFTRIYLELEAGDIDYALIPAAYERITEFFWNRRFEDNLNFLFSTPEYGLACKEGQQLLPNRKYRVACCSPVENIIGALTNGELNESNMEKVLTSSTTEALLQVLHGNADLAITNQTSFDRYRDQGIVFIS